jgi:hypothetical protein
MEYKVTEWIVRSFREEERWGSKCLLYRTVNDICFIRFQGNILVVVNLGSRLRNWRLKNILFFELDMKAACWKYLVLADAVFVQFHVASKYFIWFVLSVLFSTRNYSVKT